MSKRNSKEQKAKRRARKLAKRAAAYSQQRKQRSLSNNEQHQILYDEIIKLSSIMQQLAFNQDVLTRYLIEQKVIRPDELRIFADKRNNELKKELEKQEKEYSQISPSNPSSSVIGSIINENRTEM